MEYFDYTQADAVNDGIGFTVSRYSKKVVVDNTTVGAIIFQDTNLKIEQSIIDNYDSDESKLYYKSLNSANSIYLRKINYQLCIRNSSLPRTESCDSETYISIVNS